MTVRDHGVGLTSGEAEQVFDRFWRADPSRVRTVGGTGLGLSISLEDARLHGGWLQAWGQPGAGAQFRLTLPLIAGGTSPARRCRCARPSSAARGGRREPAVAATAAWRSLLAGLTACSTVPTSSPTVRITQVPVRPAEDVGIEPLSPEPGATPEEIVRGFIDAAASAVPGHPVAREYLRRRGGGDVVRRGRDHRDQPRLRHRRHRGGRRPGDRSLVGTVDSAACSPSAGRASFTREFTLEQVDGEWRITDPPDGLVILEPDFERLYDQRRRLLPRPDRPARRSRSRAT